MPQYKIEFYRKYFSIRLPVQYEHICDDYIKARHEKWDLTECCSCEVEREHFYNRVDFKIALVACGLGL